jgi:uncharacterized protein (TIGR02246 family)
MMVKHACRILLIGIVSLSGQTFGLAADQAADKSAIEKAIDSYTAAFNAGDAKALAEHWGPEAVYINPLTGSQVEGREAIAKEFEAILAETKDTRLVVEVASIEFVSPSVAMERGVAKLIPKDGEPSESSYTAIQVKRDGKWLLDRVTEAEAAQMVQAMQKNGIPVTYVLFTDEGHGYTRPENRLAFYAITEAFLKEYLGGRAEPIDGAFQGSSLTVPNGVEDIPGLQDAL